MKFRIVSVTNGLGQTSVYVEQEEKKPRLFGTKTYWKRILTNYWEHDFEHVVHAQSWIDSVLQIKAQNDLRNTVVETKVEPYP